VTKILHGFVRPPTIPVGYAYEINKNSDRTHNVDLDIDPMQADAAKDYEWIVKCIVNMLDPVEGGENLPPIYTLEDEVEKTKFCLSDIFHWGRHRMNQASKFRIFPLHELYFRIAQELPCGPAARFSKQMANHGLLADVDNMSNGKMFIN
jgi:hypothetical protein